jgi:YD repeat-containing protein
VPLTYTDAAGNTTNYTYNGAGQLTSVTNPLRQKTTFVYDTTGGLTTIISYTNAIDPTPSVAFTYDPYFPRITAMQDGTGTTDYTYVPVGSLGALQLQEESGPLPATPTMRSAGSSAAPSASC